MADKNYQGKRLEGVRGARLERRRDHSTPAAENTPKREPIPAAEETPRERVTPPAPAAAPEPPAPPAEAVPAIADAPEPPAPPAEAVPAAADTPEIPAPPAEIAPAADSVPEKAEKIEEEKKKKGFWADYGYLVVTAAVVILVFRVLLQLAFVPTASMESTIPTDSLLVSWQLPYLVSDPEPERGSVITFWNEELGKLLVKRVIGLPGEEITFVDGFVCVNGERIQEAYLEQQGATTSRQASFRVPEGCLFVMGDNRKNSQDSRYWKDPFVPLSNVRAQVLVCVPIKYQPVKLLPKWKGFPLPIVGEIHTVS